MDREGGVEGEKELTVIKVASSDKTKSRFVLFCRKYSF